MYNCEFDDAMPCILLFPFYEETKDKKYKITLDECASWIPKYFKTPSGGFWHKYCTPDQMWLDGFYMAQPLCVKYASVFGGHDEFYKMAYTQLKLMKKYTKDNKSGLWYHAYDESKKHHGVIR
jgi:unsaturated rhamnogalacturonyl hydrolase